MNVNFLKHKINSVTRKQSRRSNIARVTTAAAAQLAVIHRDKSNTTHYCFQCYYEVASNKAEQEQDDEGASSSFLSCGNHLSITFNTNNNKQQQPQQSATTISNSSSNNLYLIYRDDTLKINGTTNTLVDHDVMIRVVLPRFVTFHRHTDTGFFSMLSHICRRC